MIQRIFYLRRHSVGDIVNIQGAAWKVLAVGEELSAFPGGTGVFATIVEKVSDTYMTAREKTRYAQEHAGTHRETENPEKVFETYLSVREKT